MNNYALYSIIPTILVQVILGIILAHTAAKDLGSRKTLKRPTAFGIIGIVSGGIEILAVILMWVQGTGTDKMWAWVLLSAFLILLAVSSVFVVLHTFFWKLIIEKDHLIYRTSFGKTKIIPYTEVHRVCAYFRRGCDFPEQYRIFYGEGKRISFDMYTFNLFAFIHKNRRL